MCNKGGLYVCRRSCYYQEGCSRCRDSTTYPLWYNYAGPHVALRYEKVFDEFSTGLGQLFLSTANDIYQNYPAYKKMLQERFPFLKDKDELTEIDLYHPRLNLYLSALYLKILYNKCEDWRVAVFMYNHGPQEPDPIILEEDAYTNSVMTKAQNWFVRK